MARSAAPGTESNRRTGWPTLANTIAQPAPTNPVPTTPIGDFFLSDSVFSAASVSIADTIKPRRLAHQELSPFAKQISLIRSPALVMPGGIASVFRALQLPLPTQG